MTAVPARPASPMRRRLLLASGLCNLGGALLAEELAASIYLVIKRRLRPLWQALFTPMRGRLPGHASTSLTRWAGSRT